VLASFDAHRRTMTLSDVAAAAGLARPTARRLLLTLEELGETDPRVITAVHTITITITLSIVAHGITARPMSTRYVAAVEQRQSAAR